VSVRVLGIVVVKSSKISPLLGGLALGAALLRVFVTVTVQVTSPVAKSMELLSDIRVDSEEDEANMTVMKSELVDVIVMISSGALLLVVISLARAKLVTIVGMIVMVDGVVSHTTVASVGGVPRSHDVVPETAT
jgi:hypothetical protein